MEYLGSLLLVPDKPDPERDSICAAWSRQGGAVERLAKFWKPRDYSGERVVLYGPQTFGLVLAQILNMQLVSPPDDLLLELEEKWLGRRVQSARLSAAGQWGYPIFIKPLKEKQFRAAVYSGPSDLQAETIGVAADQEVILSDVLDIAAEVRSFVLDGVILDAAVYEGEADVAAARRFLERAIPDLPLPRTSVADLAKLKTGEWVILEANPAWGAGLNGCSAELVVPAIAAASAQLERFL